MANNKTRAQIQIDVSFVTNATKLVKDLQGGLKGLDLSSGLTKQLEVDLNRSFKEVFSNLNKMSEGLGKKGLNAKQYQDFFTQMNSKIQDSTRFVGNLRNQLQGIFESKENKEAIANLEKYKKTLEEINKVAAAYKGAQTRHGTAVQKLKDETGLDYGVSKRTLTKIAERKKSGQALTKTQNDWLANMGIDEPTLKRVLALLKQIQEQESKMSDQSAQSKALTGQSNPLSGVTYTTKQIAKTEKDVVDIQTYEQWNQVLSKLSSQILGVDGLSTNLLENWNSEFPRARLEAEKTAQATATLKDVFAQFGIVFTTAGLVRQFKELFTYSFNFYKSLDSALNAIYVVSNLTSGAINNLTSSFISMAKNTGMSIDDVTESAVLFYQQGLNTDEVLEMTEVTSEFAKVAGISATDAADKLTAAVNGYCLAAEDAALVADKFNKVAAASAADIDELSTAFSKAAAQANQAGVGMDNYLAYIATMVEATREAPENIGTSLKTIMSRMQQVKEGGTTEDGDTDVNKVETALKSVGVQLRDTNGELRDLEDVLGELGPKWNSLDRNTQAYLGTIIAGTRQQSRFITLMQNWDRVLELSEDSANSAGMQSLMHAKAMDSLESKLQQLTVAWQEFVSNLSSSDVLKTAVSLLTGLMNSINSGNTPLLLLSTTLALVRKQIFSGTAALGKWAVQASKSLTANKGLVMNGRKLSGSFIEQSKALVKNRMYMDQNQKMIDLYKAKLIQLQRQMDELARTDPGGYADSEAFRSMSEQAERLRLSIQGLEGDNQTLNTENQQLVGSFQAVTNGMLVLNAAFTSMQGSEIGFISSLGQVLGLLTNVGAIAAQGAIALITMSQIGTAAFKTLSAEAQASLISTGIGAIVVIIGQAINMIMQLVDAFHVSDGELADSVEKVGQALDNYSNAQTSVKSVERAKKEYEELANKVYRTKDEQEKLNEAAQELGDALDIEIIEDQYGNLSVSIDQVTEKLSALKQEAAKARAELIKNEQDEIENYDHNGKLDEFYDNYLAGYRTDIRNAMSDIETGIDTNKLKTSTTNVEQIMNNLKNNVIDSSADMVKAFGGLGVHWSLTEDVESTIKAFNEADIDADKWNDLFFSFNELQGTINDMSYDKALGVIEGSIKSWGEAAGLTTQQLNLMKDALMDSLYSESNLNATIGKYKKIVGQGQFDSQIQDYTDQMDTLYKKSNSMPKFWTEDEAEREYEAVKNKRKELEKQRKDYEAFVFYQDQLAKGLGDQEELQEKINKLKDKYGWASAEEVRRAQTLLPIYEKLSDASANWLNNAGLFDEDADTLIKQLNGSGALDKVIAAYKIDERTGTQHLTNELVNIINNTNDTELKKVAQEKLDNVFSSIQVRAEMSWGDLGDTLDDLSSDLREMNELMADFNEAGAFSLDTFLDLCNILDDLDLGAIFDAGQMNTYLAALENLNLGFDASNGMITANGEALKSLQDIQMVMTQAKLAETAQALEADKASLQAQIYMIEAEIDANQDLIDYLSKQGQASVDINTVKAQGEQYYATALQQAVTESTKLYSSMTSNSAKWAQASITNAAKVGDAIKAAMTGSLGTGNLSAHLAGLIDPAKGDFKWEGTGGAGVLDVLKDGNNQINVADAIKALQDYNKKGANTISDLTARMKSIEQMQGLLKKLSVSDLSKLGVDDKDKSKVEQYIGKLKEIYNILNRIQNLQHRLSTLDSYADVEQGDLYAKHLQQRIALNEELLDQHRFLVSEQKKFTNGYIDYIESTNLADVFDFDEYGQIIINFEKYNALQDTAADGQKSMKEQADELYETYTEMYEDLQGYFDDYIEYLQAVIDLHQEVVDNYVEIEHQAADAIKEIYQDILDTKLEAIDKEIQALEDLQKAREEAREDQQNAKDVSGLQTNLQRAMFDTSGASDSEQIKARQELGDKLDEIAEDKYSEMLENLKLQLEDQKEMLQEEFDEMFDDLQWLYEMIEANFMNNEQRLIDLFNQTDEWKEMTTAERAQQTEETRTAIKTYTEALQDGKTILDVVQTIIDLKNKTIELDEALKTQISNTGVQIANSIANGISQAVQAGQTKNTSPTPAPKTPTVQTDPGNTTLLPEPNNNNNNNNTEKPMYGIAEEGGAVYPKTNEIIGLETCYEYKNGKMVKATPMWVGTNDGEGKNKGYNPYKKTIVGANTAVCVDGVWYYKFTTAFAGDRWLPASRVHVVNPPKLKPEIYNWASKDTKGYKTGGIADFTGPAWLDGTPQKPEAVLNALQTQHFMKFTNALDHMYGQMGGPATANSIMIDTISFNVDSMSSREDGEAAFDAFVNKFKEIGSQRGMKINNFKNIL